MRRSELAGLMQRTEAIEIPGLAIERAGPDFAAVYSRTGFESFSDRGPEFVAATGMLFDARPVGGLGNGSVRPKFRGRGLQTAMIAHRIREGWARGYRMFFGQTVNPASAHNMEDLGWRHLYTEIAWERKT